MLLTTEGRIGRQVLTLAGCVLAMGITSVGARAATFTVSKLADTNDGACNADCSLREAITEANNQADASQAASTISFEPNVRGVIQLTSSLPDIVGRLSIQGPGASLLSVRGQGRARAYRFLVVQGKASASISGLSFTNGDTGVSSSGGAILNSHGRLSLSDCAFTGNAADDGGALYNDGGALSLARCVLSGNHARASGGGLVVNGGTVTAIACTFSSNSADGPGGGIYNSLGALTFTNCTIDGNTGSGGVGVYNSGRFGSASLVATGCTISNNIASNVQPGGAIVNDGFTGSAALTLTNCTLSGNQAFNGGAILNSGTNNSGRTRGAVALLRNCTLANNKAFNTNAGGIYSESFQSTGGASVTLSNTILSNSPALNRNLVNNGGVIVSQGYNLSSDTGGGFLRDPGDILSTNPLLASLANNGGPTKTHAFLPGSRAVDAGRATTRLDQRGNLRPSGVARRAPGGDGSDIGAFEAQASRLDLNGDAAGQNASAVFIVGNGPVVLGPQSALIAPDVAGLRGVSITLNATPDGSAESLSAVTSGTLIRASYSAATRTLTLSGNDTLAHYVQVLRSVRYANTSARPTLSPRSASFLISDGVTSSTAVLASITFRPNAVPVAQSQRVTARLNTPILIALSASDAEGKALTFRIARSPLHGTAVLSGASVRYTPAPGFVGADSFTFTASDGLATSVETTVAITVTPSVPVG